MSLSVPSSGAFPPSGQPPVGLSNSGATTMPSYGDPFQSQAGGPRSAQSSGNIGGFQQNADGSVSLANSSSPLGAPGTASSGGGGGGFGWKTFTFIGIAGLSLLGWMKGHGKMPVRNALRLLHIMKSPKREAKKEAEQAAAAMAASNEAHTAHEIASAA